MKTNKYNITTTILYFLILSLLKMDWIIRLLATHLSEKQQWFIFVYFDLIFYTLFFVVFVFINRTMLVKDIKDLVNNRSKYLRESVWTFAFIIVSSVTIAIFLSVVFSVGESSNEIAIDVASKSDFGVTALYVCLFGPIVEEFVFRGIIYEQLIGWVDKKSWNYICVIVVSILFMCHHMNFSEMFCGDFTVIASYIPLFFVSLGVTYLYERNRNILLPITVHMAMNILGYS